MTATASNAPPTTVRPGCERRRRSASNLNEAASCGAYSTQKVRLDCAESEIASYLDDAGRHREIVRSAGVAGSVLVIDRDRLDHTDRKLLAHLASDEPAANVELLCALYLGDRQPRCRQVAAEDSILASPTELDGQLDVVALPDARSCDGALRDDDGNRYRLAPMRGRIAIPELRWCRSSSGAADAGEAVSVRDVVGALECYEPVRGLSAAAILRHRRGRRLSVSTLSVELERLNGSRIVLNRGVREAVMAAVGGKQLSMSEIALRCGRVKRDRRGGLSGETTWLSRRIGLACDGGACAPTPWVHSDVLALIARRGLGVAPREVELA